MYTLCTWSMTLYDMITKCTLYDSSMITKCTLYDMITKCTLYDSSMITKCTLYDFHDN